MPTPPVTRVTTAPDLGTPAYVVLGMIVIGARTGYEIKQMVEQSTRFFWTISQAQIYPSLGQLEQAGLVAGREDPQGRRRRRVFEITAAGRALPPGQPDADQPQRRGRRRERPEEGRSLLDLPVGREPQEVDALDVQAADASTPDEVAGVVTACLVGVPEIGEHAEDDLGHRADLLRPGEGEPLGQR